MGTQDWNRCWLPVTRFEGQRGVMSGIAACGRPGFTPAWLGVGSVRRVRDLGYFWLAASLDRKRLGADFCAEGDLDPRRFR